MDFFRLFLRAELALTPAGWLILLIASGLISGSVYLSQQANWRAEALTAAATVDVIDAFCSQKAVLNELNASCMVTVEGQERMSRQAAWMLMRDIDLIDPNLVQHADDIGSDSPLSERAIMEFLTEDVSSPNSIMPGFQFFADVMQCKRGSLNPSVDEIYAPLMQHAVRFALGTEAERIDFAAISPSVGQNAAFDLSASVGTFMSRWHDDLDIWTLLEGAEPLSDAEIVTRGLAEAGVFGPGETNFRQALPTDGDTCLSLVEGLEITPEAEKPRVIYDIIVARSELALWAAGQIRQDETVAAARSRAALWTGYEQAGLLFFGVFGGLLVVVRLVLSFWSWQTGRRVPGPSFPHEDVLDSTDPQSIHKILSSQMMRKLGPPDDGSALSWDQHRVLFSRIVASARWPLRVVMAILPAIGFIGTVRGIKDSLIGADALVFAATNNERAAAIGALAGDLGLAFATTFIALLMTLVLTILLAIESRFIDLIGLRRMKRSALGAAKPIPETTEPGAESHTQTMPEAG
ncbi:MAG: hypothetical protein AAGD43_01870 [Pseudomonadota bacterium]